MSQCRGFSTFLAVGLLVAAAISDAARPPVWYQVQYQSIYRDDVETIAPALNQGFMFGPAGSFTSSLAEVISGQCSIKGSYSGWTPSTAWV